MSEPSSAWSRGAEPVISAFMPIRLVLADDHPIVLEGLAQLFRAAGGEFDVVALCTTGEQTLDAIANLSPHVALVDVRMPLTNGIEVLRRVRRENLPTRIVLITADVSDADFVEAVRLGAAGLVLKESASRVLLQCVRAVAAGQQWIDQPSLSRALDNVLRLERSSAEVGAALTPREMEVLGMAARGLRNRQIADQLSITEGTVKIHLHAIYRKLQLSGRMELSIYARERGLV